jgi:hypothetical protein
VRGDLALTMAREVRRGVKDQEASADPRHEVPLTGDDPGRGIVKKDSLRCLICSKTSSHQWRC